LLVWLSVEDRGVRPILLLSALSCALAAAWVAFSLRLCVKPRLPALVLVGAIAGLAVTPLAIFLMALKTGLHGHAAPDFTPGQITWVLSRTLAWVIAGLLAGGSTALWRLRRAGNP
jgi:hypothetical protein